MKLSDRIYVCEGCGNIVCRDFNASTNIRDEGIRILISKYRETTVGHTGSNDCGEDKVHVFLEKEKQVIVREAGKRITPVVS